VSAGEEGLMDEIWASTRPELQHSWASIDLVAAAANPPAPPTIGQLLYPGKRTLVSGERDSLKTWLALILAKAELDAGYGVGWADIDAMGQGDILDRLRLLGVDDETISRLFRYYAPAERLSGDLLADVAAELTAVSARMFVADAFNPFLSLHGLDPGSTSDVETFWREVADPICRGGAAVVMLDHVVKNDRQRGRYAYGSERKASGAIVHLGLRIVTPFGRGRFGASVLDCHRDRQGYLQRPVVGRLELSAPTGSVSYVLKPEGSGDEFRPTHLMERVSRHLEGLDEEASRNAIEQAIKGKANTVRLATDKLIEDGYAVETQGPRGAKLITEVRPYREDEDEARAGASVPSLVSVSDLVPARDEVGTRSVRRAQTTSSLVPPIGDEDEVSPTSSQTPGRGRFGTDELGRLKDGLETDAAEVERLADLARQMQSEEAENGDSDDR
jgi:hypothetical protein